MADSDNRHRNLSLTGKVLGLMVFGLFLVLGLVGLVLPIIPGLLFLVLALYVLTRVSRRFAFIANRNSWVRKSFRRIGHVRTLPAMDLVRLSFWVTARGVVNGTAAAGRYVAGMFNNSLARK